MMKLFVVLVIFVSSLIATTYNFSETRYSDALGKSIELHGEITFLEDGLDIKYNNSDKSLHYENGDLTYLQDGEALEISEEEITRITQYFDIVILLYSNDTKRLESQFNVQAKDNKTILTPLNEIKNYISKIELKKENKKLQELKIFISNGDNISISIEDEIR